MLTPDGPPTADLRLSLLGTFQVVAGGEIVPGSAWPLRKARSLCKLLALSPGRRLDREQIMGQLWPEHAPQAAGNNLRYALFVARRALPAGAIVGEGTTLALLPDGRVWIDVEAFEAAARRAAQTRDPADYNAALDLYGGELLPEDRYEEWTVGRREALRERHLRLLLDLAALHERDGASAAAIATLQRVLAEDATHEDAHTALMRLYALAGKPALALRQWEQFATALRQELDAAPSAASRSLRDEIAAGRFPPVTPPAAAHDARRDQAGGNLPVPLNSLIGREEARVAVKEALSAARLVTLTGSGGCGKTRLALAVATDLIAAYADGVWLIDLAALADPTLVESNVATALRVREMPGIPAGERLAEALRERETLLLLDNCEHLVAACAALADTLLRMCPRLRILATSREALGVPGEVIWHVPSLDFPALRVPAARPSPIDLAGLARLSAPRLFVDRARQRRADFALSADNAAAIVEICQRLDGIPLAIELAAARIGVLTVEQIAARLDDALGTLVGRQRAAPTRQQTMRATLDWSYALLNDAEKGLFVALAACGGGWTLDAAEAIWGEARGMTVAEGDPPLAGPTTLDLLEGLTDKSLVIAEQRGESVRYRMQEVVRQYAAARLAQDLAEQRLRRQRHASHFLALAEAIEPTLIGPVVGGGLVMLEREHDNLRAALRWSLAEATRTGTPPELALRLSGALIRFWRSQGHINEGYRWMTTLIQAAANRAADLPPAVLAKALTGAGVLALVQGDEQAARAALREGISHWREAGDRDGLARCLANLGFVEGSAGDFAVAIRLLDEGAAIFRSLDELSTVAITLDSLGFILLLSGDRARARLVLAEAIALARTLANTGGLASALGNLGLTVLGDGDVAGALALQRESLALAHGEGATLLVFWTLEGLAHAVAAIAPRAVQAARLYGAAEALRDEMGYRRLPASRAFHEGYISTVRDQLDAATFKAAWEAGRHLPLEAAIAEAFALADNCLADLAAPPIPRP